MAAVQEEVGKSEDKLQHDVPNGDEIDDANVEESAEEASKKKKRKKKKKKAGKLIVFYTLITKHRRMIVKTR